MLERKSIGRELPTIVLRRSPRFLQPELLSPKTPNPEAKRHRSLCPGSPLSSTPKGSLSSSKLCEEEFSKKGNEDSFKSKAPVKSRNGLRRSARLSGIMFKQEGLSIASQDSRIGSKSCREVSDNVEKRVTRSCNRRIDNITALGEGDRKNTRRVNKCVSSNTVTPVERKSTAGGCLLTEFVGKIERRITRSASRECKGYCEKSANAKSSACSKNASTEGLHKEGLVDVAAAKNSVKLSTPMLEREKERNVGREKEIGLKRKCDHGEEDCVVIKKWSKEQELALQRAYFAAKPTPHFWKKVARMVPGKSAQECFDKVHSDLSTPPQAQARSRAKKTTPSHLSFSASNLLIGKSKKSNYTRRKSHIAQRTVRHLLQKQYNVDQKEDTDLFAFLEATVDSSTGAPQQCAMYSTPENNRGHSFLKRCQETSSAHRKQLSRLSVSCGASLISPPVLKQIKNKALHEKYIDQLHCREAKRKAALVRAAKQVKSKTDREESRDAKLDPLEAAKSALFLDARDAINQFQHLQTSALDNSDNSDDDRRCNEDDEGEDEP